MHLELSQTLRWLVWTVAATGLMWLPYIGWLIGRLGPIEALMEGSGAEPDAGTWARRCKKAHYNAIENLAIWAPLVLVVCLLGLDDGYTANVALAYLLVRLAHYTVYTLGLPFIRTILFLGGVACQGLMLGRAMGWI